MFSQVFSNIIQLKVLVLLSHCLFTKYLKNCNGGCKRYAFNLGEYGEMLTGMLTRDDTKQTYGSAVASSFVSYIVDPETTLDITDRFLRQR